MAGVWRKRVKEDVSRALLLGRKRKRNKVCNYPLKMTNDEGAREELRKTNRRPCVQRKGGVEDHVREQCMVSRRKRKGKERE